MRNAKAYKMEEKERHQLNFFTKCGLHLIGWHFVIISNNGLGKQVLQSSHPLDRLTKWLAILQEYDFSFKIVKGDCSNLKNALIDLGENLEVNLLSTISINDPWYGGI